MGRHAGIAKFCEENAHIGRSVWAVLGCCACDSQFRRVQGPPRGRVRLLCSPVESTLYPANAASPSSMSITMSGASEIVLVDDPALFLRLLPSLAALLHACVSTGASINFVQPFTLHGAEAFWTRQLDDIVHSGHQRLYATLDGDAGGPAGPLRALGCVILRLAHQPNQQHRCDLSKMLVHPDARRQCVALPLAVAVVQPGSLTLPLMLRSLKRHRRAAARHRRGRGETARKVVAVSRYRDGQRRREAVPPPVSTSVMQAPKALRCGTMADYHFAPRGYKPVRHMLPFPVSLSDWNNSS